MSWALTPFAWPRQEKIAKCLVPLLGTTVSPEYVPTRAQHAKTLQVAIATLCRREQMDRILSVLADFHAIHLPRHVWGQPERSVKLMVIASITAVMEDTQTTSLIRR